MKQGEPWTWSYRSQKRVFFWVQGMFFAPAGFLVRFMMAKKAWSSIAKGATTDLGGLNRQGFKLEAVASRLSSSGTLTSSVNFAKVTLAQTTLTSAATKEYGPFPVSARRNLDPDGNSRPYVLFATTTAASEEPLVKVRSPATPGFRALSREEENLKIVQQNLFYCLVRHLLRLRKTSCLKIFERSHCVIYQ